MFGAKIAMRWGRERSGHHGKPKVGVAFGDEVVVLDLQGETQGVHPHSHEGRIGALGNLRLKLEEAAEILDVVEVNPDLPPEEVAAVLHHHHLDPEGPLESLEQDLGLGDVELPAPGVGAGKAKALVGEEMRPSPLFLAHFESAAIALEIGVALQGPPSWLGTQERANRQRAPRVVISGLQLRARRRQSNAPW